MRKLYIVPGCAELPSTESVLRLITRFSDDYIFPNLLELEWYSSNRDPDLSNLLPLVVSRSLANFKLFLHNRFYAKKVLSGLSRAYSSLRSIYITKSNPALVQESSTLLLNCTLQLRDFSVDAPVSRTAFLHASQLPYLRYFDVKDVRDDQLQPPDGTPLPTTKFPSLEYLAIRGICTGSIWLDYLAQTRPQNLEVLLLELKNVPAALHLKALRDLGSCELHRTLTDLMIDCEDDFSGLEVDRKTVEHLLPLSQLTTLEIWFNCGENKCGYKLTDQDLEKLVKAMPNLEEMALGRKLCSIPANNSIKSLEAIAKHCKHLRVLSIHINVGAVISGSSVTSFSGVESPSPRDSALVKCPLTNITLGPCLIPNGKQGIHEFASTLLRLFPCLSEVKSSYQDQQWKLVHDLVVDLSTKSGHSW